jgi:L-alanine-DL-glutamate epimerase-like enolase superfamily enzyme
MNLPTSTANIPENAAQLAQVTSWTDDTLCIVCVTDKDGAVGWGQCAPYAAPVTSELLHRLIVPRVLSRPCEPIGPLVDGLFDELYKFSGSFLCRAIGGLDTALWDLAARRRGVPVCELAGGRPRSLPVYASSMRRDLTPEGEAERMLAIREAHGITAFKCKIGAALGRLGRNEDAAPGRSEAIIPLLRRTLGNEATLIADANGAYTPDQALVHARHLAEHGYAAFEEPCPSTEIDWIAEVRAAGGIAIAGGEQDYLLPSWRRLINLPAIDICQPDIGYVGGFHRALTVARMADAAGRHCTSHVANHSALLVFGMHLLSAIARPWSHLEYSLDRNASFEGLYEEPAVRDGRLPAPSGPGWGITFDPARLARMSRRDSAA